jgi:Flp pilus assembly protein TadD
LKVLSAVLLVLAAVPALAADEWIRVTTPHFEVYTTAGERRGRDIAREFEKVREFFERASPLKTPPDAPVRIILFHTEEQYAQYAINGVAVAFYASGPTRDYIVLQDSPQKYPTAIHEYMHLVIRHSGLRIPLWLNEGWSDVYSTLRPTRDGVAVGDLLPGRISTLEHGTWLDFDALTSTTQSSPAYNEATHAGMFYAESWALAHMLYLAPDYKDHFAQFVAALHHGATTAEACRKAYGKTPSQVYADLRNYLGRKKLYGALFETPLTKAEEEPKLEKLSSFDSGLLLADLLAATNRKNFARQQYERLDKIRPGQPEVAEALGYISLSVGDRAGAREKFRRAFDQGSTDAPMCVELARMEREGNAAPSAVIPILERALKSRPDYPEAQIQLGLAKLAARDYAGAISMLVAVHTVPPDEATSVFSALAYASTETGDLESARGYAATALEWAPSEQQKKALAQLNTLIEARTRVTVRKGEPLADAHGTAANVVCSPAGNRLQLLSEGHTLTFEMPDSRAIEFSQPGGGALEMRCGPQKPRRMLVEYVPAPAGSIVAGVVRKIEVEAAQ